MSRMMFGVETEYAIAGINGRKALNREDLVNQFMRVARRRLAHLPDVCSHCGIYLGNGGRFYIDHGLHPELTTPECTTPWQLARYIKAGERTLERLRQEVQAEAGGGAEIMCFRCNVDYGEAGSTWGCHESYLHRADPKTLPEQLIPHLVTRVIYTGAGGFNPLARGLEFSLAPRLMYIQHEISGDSTGNRGIFHTKNESLSGMDDNRLHILCGESLCSETAIVLKIGVTALVVAMAAEGLKPGKGMKLELPLDALRQVSADITCRQKLPLAGGGEATAIEIQRRLLRMAERHAEVLPSWSSEICALWGATLDRLESAPDAVAASLDWAIKHRLYHDRLERSGISQERCAFLNSIVRRMSVALATAGLNDRSVRLDAILGPRSPIPEEAAQLESALKAEGLATADLDRFLVLRNEFYQIDTRFGQLGPRGIFSELDRLDVLGHKVAGIDGPDDSVDAAMSRPPSVGRAKLRGESIHRLSGQEGAKCNWMAVYGADGRVLDLSDPFASAEAWSEPGSPGPEPDEMFLQMAAGEEGDHGRFHQMLEAIRGRRRAQSRGDDPF